MISGAEFFVGRKQELRRISSAFEDGKHVLLFGEEGCGKTALAREFARQMVKANPWQHVFVSSQSVSLKDTCLELAESLHRLSLFVEVPESLSWLKQGLSWEKTKVEFRKLPVVPLKNLILANIKKDQNCVIVFDQLGKIKLRLFRFLDSLRDDAKFILITRSVKKEEMGRLWMLLWKFEKIEIKLLSFDETKQLASHWLEGVDFETSEEDKRSHEIFRASHGNPGILRGLCEQIRKQHTNSNVKTNVHLADIDRKITDFMKQKVA